MGLRATVGVVLGVLSVICAVVGLFVFEGISIELPGIILGALGYYFGLRRRGPRGTGPRDSGRGPLRYLHGDKRPFGASPVTQGK